MVSTRGLASKAAAPPGRRPPLPSPGIRLGDADADGSGGTQDYERRRDERIRENMERMHRGLASKAAAPPGRRPPLPSPGIRLGDADADGSGGTQEYERRRDERIRENMERMQRLGIVDLARKLRSSISGGSSASKRTYNKTKPSPDFTPRRSSRLQNVTPVSYSEIEGPDEEVYTDEHEELFGTCETSWPLFVDGYSKDGVRIYDPVNGKTCHLCREKTLGHRTNCSKCKIVEGQFCGDCLYLGYGENVLEANKNPNWICPVCRGICNCDLCLTKKG